MTWHPYKDKLREGAEADDPNVDEPVPELVLKSGRIFQPKNEEVSSDDDAVEEEQHLDDDRVLERKVNQAKVLRQRTVKVSQQIGRLNKDDELDASPACGGQEPVKQSSFGIRAKFFVPDDTQQR